MRLSEKPEADRFCFPWIGVCVSEIVSHSVGLISAAFYAPIRSLTLQLILNFGKEKKKNPSLALCSLKKVHGKKKREWKENLLHLCRQPKSSLWLQPKTKLKRLECWCLAATVQLRGDGSSLMCNNLSNQFKTGSQTHTHTHAPILLVVRQILIVFLPTPKLCFYSTNRLLAVFGIPGWEKMPLFIALHPLCS